MFVDRVEIVVSSGKGGEGAISFRREKFVINGGPDGGNGGRGGNVYFLVDNNTHTLSHFRGQKTFKAKNGQPGQGKNKYGKKGEDLVIVVPPGTQVFDSQTHTLLLDLVQSKQKTLFLEGGKGGLGNVHFKSSVNQRPTYAQKGMEGVSKAICLELKLIADIGLVGYPNVGKSTLISVLSHAKPQIADYEFTTLTPFLGIVDLDYDSFVMADIPGIIRGASQGKGLGLDFLRHIERTRYLLFVLDVANLLSLKEQFCLLRQELEQFQQSLYQRKFGIVFSKCDLQQNPRALVEDFLNQMGLDLDVDSSYKDCFVQQRQSYEPYKEGIPVFAMMISSLRQQNLGALKAKLYGLLQEGDGC